MKAKAKKAIAGTGFTAALTVGVSFMNPLMAFASEGEKSGIALILPDMNEFIPMLIAFIVVAIILAKFGWPVVDNIIEKRKDTIKDALEKSESARIESERVLEEYKAQLAEAKTQAAQIVADARQTGEAVKADITAKAQSEATDMIAKARVAIEAEKKSAIAELQGSIVDTSVAVAARLVGEGMNDDEHRKVIERYVNEAGSFNAN